MPIKAQSTRAGGREYMRAPEKQPEVIVAINLRRRLSQNRLPRHPSFAFGRPAKTQMKPRRTARMSCKTTIPRQQLHRIAMAKPANSQRNGKRVVRWLQRT